MRNHLLGFLIVGSILLTGSICSCNTSSKETFIENFGAFIADVDTSSKNYSKADWQTADEQFSDFKDNQFPQWEDLMSPTEKANVNKMIGKYQALQIKKGIQDIKSEVNDVIDQSKTVINEIVSDSTLTK